MEHSGLMKPKVAERTSINLSPTFASVDRGYISIGHCSITNLPSAGETLNARGVTYLAGGPIACHGHVIENP